MNDAVALNPYGDMAWARAVALASAEQRPIPYHLLKDIRDPWRCPEQFLPYLARALGVRLWSADWPLEKRRYVVAKAKEHARAAGSEWLADEYAALVDAEMLSYVARPQGVYPIEEWTDAERASYLAQLDQVRIHRFYPVDLEADGFFARDSFWAEDFFESEPAWHGYRKHAVLRRADGTEIDLDIQWQQQVSAEGTSTEIETIVLPGEPDAGLYADAGFFDEDFFDVAHVGDRLIQVTTAGAYHYSYGRLQFGVVFPKGLDVGVEPELIFETMPADGCGTFASDDFFGDGFFMPDESWQQVYERYYLNNSSVNLDPLQTAGCYYDDAWYDWEPFTALVTAELTGAQAEFGADEAWDLGFFLPPEIEDYWQLCDAVHASKALGDTLYLDTATHRWPHLGDRLPLDGSWSLGEMINDR